VRPQSRLDDLRAQDAELGPARRDEATQAPTAGDLAAVADDVERLIAEAEPQKRKRSYGCRSKNCT
jgi:hypothetical protein